MQPCVLKYDCSWKESTVEVIKYDVGSDKPELHPRPKEVSGWWRVVWKNVDVIKMTQQVYLERKKMPRFVKTGEVTDVINGDGICTVNPAKRIRVW